MLFPGNTDYTGRHAGEFVPRKRRGGKLLLCAAILMLLTAVVWPFVEPYMIEVERVTLQSYDLPASIGQLRIVYVSDIHAGPFFGEKRVEALVERMNKLNADIVLLGGDYAEDSDGAVEFFQSLPPIKARYGVYAVVGNHDRTMPESNLARLTAAMKAANVTPLVNEVASISIGAATIWLAGIDDVHNGHPRLADVAAQVNSDDYVIFLSHSPRIIPSALETRSADRQLNWFDLGLFGHTHGGQIALFGGVVRDESVPEAFRSGWTRANRIDLLTSRGVGTSVLPVRLLCRPQIHCITIQSDK